MRMFAVTLMAGSLLAQEPAPVRVNVRLVQVNVIVRNRADEPVTGLDKDDFEITDNGKPQKISFFEAVNADEVKPPAALPENTFSNRTHAGEKAAPGVSVVLFDQLNTAFEDQAYAKDQALQVLRQIQPNQRIGVYVLGRELTVLHDFTDSPTQLAAVLEQLQGQTSHAFLGAQEGPLPTPIETRGAKAQLLGPVDLMSRTQGMTKQYDLQYRTTVTLNAIQAIANHLASTTGRKNLIWVSGWFPYEMRVFDARFERTMRAVGNANMAIYPVDARGLRPLPGYDAGTKASGNPSPTLHVLNFAPMKDLASESGGQAFFNTNDLAKAIQTALDDGRITYTLGFYPESAADNKFHTLKVKVRRNDVTLRYRLGYVAMAQGPANTDPTLVLRELLASPLDAAGIGITVKLKPPLVKGEAWTVHPIIDSDDLALEDRAGRRVGQLQLVYSVQDQAGKELQGVRDEVNLDLKPAVWKEIQANGLALDKEFTPPANAATIRIAVYDPGSGRSGCVSVPLNPN